MEIRKINSNCSSALYHKTSNIPREISDLLSFCNSSLMPDETEALYVSDNFYEKQLQNFFNTRYSHIAAFIGLAGTGKTTVLKHSLETITDCIKIEKNRLICANFFWEYDYLENKTFSLEDRISYINTKLQKHYPKLKNYMLSSKGHNDFNEYITKSYPPVFSSTSIIYQITKLKFLLMSDLCPIRQIIICIDNIDDLPISKSSHILSEFLSLYEILNYIPSSHTGKYYTVNLLFSVRPETYNAMCQNNLFGLHQIKQIVDKKNVINLEKLLHKLIKIYCKNKNINNFSLFEKYGINFAKVGQRFNGKYDTMIKNLTFYNIPETLLLYAKIIYNIRWLNYNSTDYSQSGDEQILNNISVIRALSCGENEMFINSSTGPVSNILFNTAQKNYSILCLYTISLFIQNDETTTTIYRVKEICTLFETIFRNKEEISQDIRYVLHYLLSHRILKVIPSNDTINSAFYDGQLPPDNFLLYLSSKGQELFKMLQSDSVLFEMCREDYYRSYNIPGSSNNPYSSYHLMQTNQQHEIFIDLCRILDELIILEETYLTSACKNNTYYLLTQKFGSNMMCSYLIKGLEKSMEYSGLINHKDVYKHYSDIISKIHLL